MSEKLLGRLLFGPRRQRGCETPGNQKHKRRKTVQEASHFPLGPFRAAVHGGALRPALLRKKTITEFGNVMSGRRSVAAAAPLLQKLFTLIC